MSEELDQELEERKRLAIRLVEHLRTVKAAVLAIPVTVDGKNYEVTASPEGNADQALALLEFVRIRKEQRKHEQGPPKHGYRKIELRGRRRSGLN